MVKACHYPNLLRLAIPDLRPERVADISRRRRRQLISAAPPAQKRKDLGNDKG